MIKKILFTFCLLLPSLSFAQLHTYINYFGGKNSNQTCRVTNNSLGVNLEKRFSFHYFFNAGLAIESIKLVRKDSSVAYDSINNVNAPLSIGRLFGQNKHFLEASVGFLPSYSWYDKFDFETAFTTLGYRYISASGFTFRGYIMPIWYAQSDSTRTVTGLSLGYQF